VADDADVFTCPRCGEPAVERFYGPCGACREHLRSTLGGPGRTIAAVTYEPKVNVTPNSVAQRADD
jgi:hypothetical protein